MIHLFSAAIFIGTLKSASERDSSLSILIWPLHTTVVVFCGNNDLNLHTFEPWLTAESAVEVATSLCNFKIELELRNLYTTVKNIGLLPRPDVERVVMQSTKTLLYEHLSLSYVSPQDIDPYDPFEADGVHLNVELGIYHSCRMFERIIQSVN